MLQPLVLTIEVKRARCQVSGQEQLSHACAVVKGLSAEQKKNKNPKSNLKIINTDIWTIEHLGHNTDSPYFAYGAILYFLRLCNCTAVCLS